MFLVVVAKSPWCHIFLYLLKYALKYFLLFLSLKKYIGFEGNVDLQTNSPLFFINELPLSSNISTSIPSALHCISPEYTDSFGLPVTKQETISVPPLIDAK